MGGIIAKNREDRQYALTDGGGASGKLSHKFKRRCLKNADRTFAQATQCQETNSIAALLSMEDAAFVVHAPNGCVGCVSFINDNFKVGQYHRGIKHIRNARYIVTNVDERDIVLGGEKKVRNAVLELQRRYDPNVIFVFTSCSSGIIGDDIDAVVKNVQEEVRAIVIPIHCEGFKSKVPATGFDTVFKAIGKYIIKGERPKKEKGLINIFATTSIGYKDQMEMEKLLKVLGLHVNYIPFYSNVEKLKKIPAAEYSVAVCQVFADEFMEYLKNEYDIPYSKTGMPIGIRSTDNWFLSVARMVGKEEIALKYIEEEHKRILPKINEIKERIKGKKVFICAGTGRGIAAATLIEDFGMKLIGIQTPTYEEALIENFEELEKIHGDNFIIDIANMQPFEQSNLVNKLKPDLFIGISTWVSKLGIPTTHILEAKRPTFGYNGLIYLGRKIENAVENPSFNIKLAKRKKLPYKKQWYSENAFKYFKEVGNDL
ncbi:nitrogenase component 1 [Clostridium felsineum]|uniref:nitrogenase component 1 n=1 Tax=Clostridium felsineum TaxID=36839 RepID=UPI00098BE12B|nr:nitrogenase component 1 [Clostridium felsineum]URZ18398.1 Nitrogenase molybdenum-iron protein alpha chain [Clostridium felsineum DSM 794]